MASVEESIYTRITGDTSIGVSTRVYPVLAPQSATLPFITYQRVGGETLNHMTGTTGDDHGIYQVDIWAASYSSAKSVALKVRNRLNGWSQSSSPTIAPITHLSEQDQLESPDDGGDVPLYRVIQEYSIWSA